ncbi:MAG: hypothetical protein H0W08_15320, partial [Acidobacteria bacterium]|nr:hypothetical protein [Acidobacteriota bacterium]
MFAGLRDSQPTAPGRIRHAPVVGDELEGRIVNRQCRRQVDRVQGSHERRTKGSGAVENRGREFDEIHRFEQLLHG